ncbi:MAG: hypothetical protein ABIA78_02380 [archaeon]
MEEKITLLISRELKERIEEKINKTEFKSVENYLLYFLEQIVSEEEGTWEQGYTEEEEKDIRGPGALSREDTQNSPYSEEDEAALKKNLEDLGYL